MRWRRSAGRHRQVGGPAPPARQAAARWLLERLADGPAPAGTVRKPAPGTLRAEGELAGFTWANVSRALDEIGAVEEYWPEGRQCRYRLPAAAGGGKSEAAP